MLPLSAWRGFMRAALYRQEADAAIDTLLELRRGAQQAACRHAAMGITAKRPCARHATRHTKPHQTTPSAAALAC